MARGARSTAGPAARPGGTRSGGARAGGARAGSRGPKQGSAGRSAASRTGIGAGSGRPIWLIGAVAVVLVALILPYFQKWLVQRSQIEAARASVSESQAQVQDLSEQLKQWEDDQYVKAQARERLHYVMPGETGFVVVAPERKTSAGSGSAATTVPAGNRPWYSDIWLSAQVAGGGGSP